MICVSKFLSLYFDVMYDGSPGDLDFMIENECMIMQFKLLK